MIRNADLQNRAVNPSQLSDRQSGAPSGSENVSPSRLADYWGVHVNTVYRDIRKGALPAVRLPSGRIRIRRQDADRYGRPQD